jgi:putative DNA primase/helicase
MTELENAPEWLVKELTSCRTPANRNTSPSGFLSEGSRNKDLTSLAGFLRRRFGCGEDELFDRLMLDNNAANFPLPESEVRTIARSVAGYPNIGLSNYDDIPLSRSLAAHLVSTTRYSDALGWMTYTGKSWVSDGSAAAVQETAKKFAELIFQSTRSNSDQDDNAIKRARQILASNKISRAISLASSDPQIRCTVDDFDAQPNLLNMRNATLNLATGELRDHEAGDLITRVANASYDVEASCPNFDRLLNDSLPEEHRRFALRLFGYALLGVPDNQIFVLFYGQGANGKSTLVNAVTSAIGDYAANAEPSTFIRQKSPGIRNDLARLKGARMVVTSELATGEILDAPLVKRLTGGDPITARFLHKELFEYEPQFVMFMVTNALPVINGADAAMARRIALIPFDNIIPEEERDPSLPSKLKAETAGIMNRLLEGLRDFQENGLAMPDDLKAEADRYTRSSDMILGFLQDRCEEDPDSSVAAGLLQINYRTWCGENGLRPLSQPQFKEELIKKTNITPVRTRNGFVWPGLSLRRPSM